MHRLMRTPVAVAALLCLCSALPAASEPPPSPVADLFFQRVTRLLSGVSATPLRVWSSGADIFFESTELRLPAGVLSFAGRLAVDPSGGGFEGVLERLTVDGRQRLDLGRPTRIRGAPDGTLAIEGFEASGPFGEVTGEGTLGPDGRLELSGRMGAVDLRAFGLLFGDEPIASGRLTAALTVSGTQVGAEVRVDGSLDPGGGLPPVEAVALRARWSGGTLGIVSCDGRLGGSPFRLSGRVEHLMDFQAAGRVDLSLEGDRLLLYRTEEVLLRGGADLRLSGPAARLALSGRIVLTEGRYEGRLPATDGMSGLLAKTAGNARRLALFALRAWPWRDMTLDVTVATAAPLQVATPAARIAARPDLRLAGTGGGPVLLGRVDFDPGVLHLPGGRLGVSAAVLRFQRPDPDRPTLEVVGSGRLQGYEVTAVVEGPFDEPRVTLSSYPVLANDELVQLLLTGQTPRAPRPSEAETSRGLNVAVALGKDMLARFGGTGRGTETTQSVMDRFDVEVGRGVTRTGDETVHMFFRVADGVVQPRDTLFLTGEKDVFGYYNGGVRIVFRFP
jgi:translocation and assembly module TamB